MFQIFPRYVFYSCLRPSGLDLWMSLVCNRSFNVEHSLRSLETRVF